MADSRTEEQLLDSGAENALDTPKGPDVRKEPGDLKKKTAAGKREKKKLSDGEAKACGEKIAEITANVESAILGKHEVTELVLLCLIAGGHVLIEDVPGVGKTSLASAVARSVDCGFKRIQFTPDLMPSDVTGFSIYNQKTGEFEFRQGAVMSNLVLADEINRASAKTQASLLEAMEEKQVTVDGTTYRLEQPFMVIATQNSVESFGTYPLPEAQVDRFFMKLSMGYPAVEEEVRVVIQGDSVKKELKPVISKDGILKLREKAARVIVEDRLARYIVEIVSATRTSAETVLGSSPRGSISLYNAARVYALMHGRNYVIPDDIKYLAPHVLAHRLTLSHETKIAGRTERDVIGSILQSIIVPVTE